MTLSERYELRNNIKNRLRALGKTQIYLSRVFKKTPQQITQALLGYHQPTLLKKIQKHLELLESKSIWVKK